MFLEHFPAELLQTPDAFYREQTAALPALEFRARLLALRAVSVFMDIHQEQTFVDYMDALFFRLLEEKTHPLYQTEVLYALNHRLATTPKNRYRIGLYFERIEYLSTKDDSHRMRAVSVQREIASFWSRWAPMRASKSHGLIDSRDSTSLTRTDSQQQPVSASSGSVSTQQQQKTPGYGSHADMQSNKNVASTGTSSKMGSSHTVTSRRGSVSLQAVLRTLQPLVTPATLAAALFEKINDGHIRLPPPGDFFYPYTTPYNRKDFSLVHS